MTLLREIQTAALASATPLPDLLRRCRVLAARVGSTELAEWTRLELGGYDSKSPVPEYRRVAVASLGDFSGPFGTGIQNLAIPLSLLPQKLRRMASVWEFRESVSALAALADQHSNGVLRAAWSADVIAYAAQRVPIVQDMVLFHAWRQLSTAQVLGVLDAVRTRVLEFSLALEAEAPDAGDALPGAAPTVSPAQVTTIYNTTIMGGLANIGESGRNRIGDGNVLAGSTGGSKQEFADLIAELRSCMEPLSDSERTDALAQVTLLERQVENAPFDPERVRAYLDLIATIYTVAVPTVEKLRELFGL